MLRTVEAPLALPFVMAGVRTASIEVVATSTLAAYVSYTDLGTLVITRPQHQRLGGGLQRRPAGGRHGRLVALALSLLTRVLTPAPLRRTESVRGPVTRSPAIGGNQPL